MVKNHLKRISAPRTWNIHRKKSKFIARPNPGAHPMLFSIPLSVLLIENLKHFQTMREVKFTLSNKEILINGKIAYDPSSSIGLLDTLSIPKLNKYYRVIVDKNDKLRPISITKEEASRTIVKITGKVSQDKTIFQLTTTQGRSFLIKKTASKVGDSLLIELPSQKILSEIKLEKGASAYIFKGGYGGQIVEVIGVKAGQLSFTRDKKEHETRKEYAIIVGKDKPEIALIEK